MTDGVVVPPLGTVERAAWDAGARAEARERDKGLTDDNREVVEFVAACASAGYTKDAIVRYLAVVFGPGLPWRARREVIWTLLRGHRVRRWYAEAEISRSDFGLGARWERDDTGLHIWVTVLVLVVHARKARR
jgi:hypothetical protein